MDANHIRMIAVKLKVISQLEIGDKLDTHRLEIMKDTYYTRVIRYLYNENRNSTILFIRNTIDQSISLIKIQPSLDAKIKTNFINDLKKAIVGIQNIQETYGECIRFVSEMDEIIQKIKDNVV